MPDKGVKCGLCSDERGRSVYHASAQEARRRHAPQGAGGQTHLTWFDVVEGRSPRLPSNATPPASGSQLRLVQELCRERVLPTPAEEPDPVSTNLVTRAGMILAQRGPIPSHDEASLIIDYLRDLPRRSHSNLSPAASGVPRSYAIPFIAPGRYAVHTSTGLQFYEIKRPDHGDYAGSTFVTRQVGDAFYPVNAGRARVVLKLISQGPLQAMLRYGREKHVCPLCSTPLRGAGAERGIGGKCARKLKLIAA